MSEDTIITLVFFGLVFLASVGGGLGAFFHKLQTNKHQHQLKLKQEETRRAELELEKYKLDNNIVKEFKPKDH